MAERNLLVTAKADRENELVRTLIQVTSAALLLLPAIISSKEVAVPRFSEALIFYGGLVALACSLLLAIAEQHLSSIAYDKQIAVVFDYYTKKSDKDNDSSSVSIVRLTRIGALILFATGIILSAFGLAMLL